MNSKIMFIGGYYDRFFENDIIINNKDQLLQTAANEFQRKLIEGFVENGYKVDVYSLPFVKNFTLKNLNFSFKDSQKNLNDNICLNYLSFNNLFGYKNISRKKSIIRRAKKLSREGYFNNIEFIYIYSAHTPFVQFAKWIKKRYPQINVVLNILDLPEYMNLSKKSVMYKILKKIDSSIFNKNLKFIDKYVLITNKMADYLKIDNYIVVEGISDDYLSLGVNCKKDNSQPKIITYTGTLNKKFGIEYLIKSFIKLKNDNVELHLAGSGDYQNDICDYIKKYKNIVYHGKLNIEDSRILQTKSDILVNPRLIDDFTKYSFPSKLIEYMEIGVPVISAKLEDIPNVYDDYLIYFYDNTLDDLSFILQKTLNLSEDERILKGEKNRSFILREKNKKYITKRIIDYISENKNE